MANPKKREQIIETLRINPIFSNLNDDELFTISNIAEIQHYEAEQYVFKIDGEAGFLYIVIEGELELSFNHFNGKIFKRGDLFGEIALVSRKNRTGSVKALTDSRLIIIREQDLFDPDKLDYSVMLSIYRDLARLALGYFI